MAKIYKGSIRKDHLPTILVIGGAGALIVFMTLVVFYLWIGNATAAGIQLSDIALNAGFFFIMFLIGIGACFYLLWRGVSERVIVEDGGLKYFATFFNKSIQALDIEKIMIFDKEQPIIIYNAGGELKQLKLPSWKSNDYIDSLIADLKRMNPNIHGSDLRKGTGVEVRYEEAVPDVGKPE